MNNTRVLVYGGLLVVALIASYLTWTHEPPGGKGDVLVIGANQGVQQVVFEEEELRVQVQSRTSEQGDYCWGDTRKVRKAPRKPPTPPMPEEDAAADDDSAADESAEAEPEPEKITEEKSFRGNETCDRVLERFTPMKALREFSELGEEKIAEMGLDEPEATLTVTTDKGDRIFDVGDRSYGNSDYYLRDRESSAVYLVESRMIGDMKGGHTRLMERDVHAFDKADVETAAITDGQGSRIFVQQNRDDSKNAYWADPADTTRTADAADAWMDQVLRLRAVEYYKDQPGDLQPLVRVGFHDAGKELGWMELGTGLDPLGEPVHVARSSNTVEWVKVSENAAVKIIDGLGEVLAVE